MDFQNKKDIPKSVTSIMHQGLFYIRDYVDRKLLVLLLDGRCIIGIMRSFDHFGTIVLETAFERIVVGNQYCDNPMGRLLVLRAENIILIGDLEPWLPQLPPHITSLPLPQILTARKAGKDSLVPKRNLKVWMEELLEDM